MVPDSPTSADRLWAEYSQVFKEWDDLTLGRWLAQTLGQVHGRIWRLSHPLLSTYRLATLVANERDIWQKRIVQIPHGYDPADCCGAPILPLFSRDVTESGLICEHCGSTAVPLSNLPKALQSPIKKWAQSYQEAHQIAHWQEARKQATPDYQDQFETAAKRAEQMLEQAAQEFLPQLLDLFPAIIWEDQDECLDIRPEDIGDS